MTNKTELERLPHKLPQKSLRLRNRWLQKLQTSKMASHHPVVNTTKSACNCHNKCHLLIKRISAFMLEINCD